MSSIKYSALKRPHSKGAFASYMALISVCLCKLKMDFKEFKLHIYNSPVAHEALICTCKGKPDHDNSFQKSWDCFRTRFKLFHSFCGGLATVFSGTATVESDFLVLHWERTPFRNGLLDLSLEGIMQCKQELKISFLNRN